MSKAHASETLITAPTVTGLADVIQFPSQRERGFFDSHASDNLEDQPFQIAHGKVEVPGAYEPVTYTLTVAADLLQTTPHVIVPGFGGFKRSSRLLRNHLSSSHNSAALSYEPVRVSNPLESLFDAQRVHTDTLTAILDDLSVNPQIRDMENGDKLNLSKVIFDPHSMGGLAVTRYAKDHPEDVSLITFLECVGLEDPKWSRFFRRIPGSIKNDIGPAIYRRELDGGEGFDISMLYKAVKYYAANPARTVGEIASCTIGDVRRDMQMLGSSGVKLAMLYGEHDTLVPAFEAISGAGHLVDHCQVIENAGHVAPQSHLHAKTVARHVADITHKLLQPTTVSL